MREHYIKFINDLILLGIYKDYKVITYSGKIPSYNQIYSTPHWGVRSKMKNVYHTIFNKLLYEVLGKPQIPSVGFSICIFFNGRLDVDNVVGVEKYLVDAMVHAGYVAGDSQKYYKSLVITPDKTLPKNTVEFYFITHNESNEG